MGSRRDRLSFDHRRRARHARLRRPVGVQDGHRNGMNGMNGMTRFRTTLAALAIAGALGTGHAHDRLPCSDDPARAHELRVLDEAEITDLVANGEPRAVPQRLLDLLHELVAVSPRLRQGPAVHLLGFDDAELNAYAADHGLIILTSALWRPGAGLSDDELAAVIAHELAHIEARHALVEACGLLQRLGEPGLSIQAARERIAPALFDPHGEASNAARAVLHAQEHAADLRAIELLRLAGRDPRAMARALERLHGGTPAALNLLMGSTHPELGERLRQARAAAAPR